MLSFIHGSPGELTAKNSETDPMKREKLNEFKTKISSGRLIKYWTNSAELPGSVALALIQAMRTHPRVGWVRADRVAKESALLEISELKRANTSLQQKISTLSSNSSVQAIELAGMDESFELRLIHTYRNSRGGKEVSHTTVTATWNEIFREIAPTLMSHPNSAALRIAMARHLSSLRRRQSADGGWELDERDFSTVMIQFEALGLVQSQYSQATTGGYATFYSLTTEGTRKMFELRAIRPRDGEGGE